jgi:hypothetical protein
MLYHNFKMEIAKRVKKKLIKIGVWYLSLYSIQIVILKKKFIKDIIHYKNTFIKKLCN